MITKKPIAITVLLSLVALAVLIMLASFVVRSRENALAKKQEELAVKLGVVIEDHPYGATFPEGYFYTILEPGMSIEAVHSLVKEYNQVFSCYGTDELYYYFTNDDQKALRFMIYYDKQRNFVRMYGEDDDSRTLSKSGCVPGLLKE